jgi:hypothetical protein
MISRLTLPIAWSVAFWEFVLISHFLHLPSELVSLGSSSTVGGFFVVEGLQYYHTPLIVEHCFFIEYQSFQSPCLSRMIKAQVTI